MSNHGGFHRLFEARAAEEPERTAVIDGARQISYGELNLQANRLTQRLLALGAGPEVCIGVWIDASAQSVVALLGILKSGSAYVPLDPRYPAARLRFICSETRLRLAVAEGAHATRLRDAGIEIVLPDDTDQWPSTNPRSELSQRNLAYVMFTSGSTGSPKGVAIEHGGTTSLMHWAREEFGDALTCVLASSSISFDMSVFEIFAPLSHGGTIAVAESVLDLRRLGASVPLTLISTVPSALAELVELAWMPPSLRNVVAAGEPLRRDHVRRLFAKTNVERLWNLYGVSEDTTYTTAAIIRRGDEENPVSIGRPIRDREIYVLDEDLEPTPNGEAGELFIGGVGLARGYVGRAELTAARFLPNPFSTVPGARMYRTGDLVRVATGGALEYLGRTDLQLKLRGYRIETGEIEAVLCDEPDVRASAVVLRENGGDRHLAAYVVPARPEISVAALRSKLQERLAPWMVPAVIKLIDALPLTANGKVDRNALR